MRVLSRIWEGACFGYLWRCLYNMHFVTLASIYCNNNILGVVLKIYHGGEGGGTMGVALPNSGAHWG